MLLVNSMTPVYIQAMMIPRGMKIVKSLANRKLYNSRVVVRNFSGGGGEWIMGAFEWGV